MEKEILGFESAKAESKRIGRNNMVISAPLVLELCEEIERLRLELKGRNPDGTLIPPEPFSQA